MYADANGQLYLWNPDDPPRRRAKPRVIDYEKLALEIGSRTVTKQELKELTGVYDTAINHIIDTLSIQYTLYDVTYDTYRMATPVKPKRK